MKTNVIKAENNIRKFGGTVTSGKIIAEQTLSFWTSFFDGHHYRLLSGIPIGAFPFKPRAINRSVISAKLKRIREFRNRIYHNEPICFENEKHNQKQQTEINQLKSQFTRLTKSQRQK